MSEIVAGTLRIPMPPFFVFGFRKLQGTSRILLRHGGKVRGQLQYTIDRYQPAPLFLRVAFNQFGFQGASRLTPINSFIVCHAPLNSAAAVDCELEIDYSFRVAEGDPLDQVVYGLLINRSGHLDVTKGAESLRIAVPPIAPPTYKSDDNPTPLPPDPKRYIAKSVTVHEIPVSYVSKGAYSPARPVEVGDPVVVVGSLNDVAAFEGLTFGL